MPNFLVTNVRSIAPKLDEFQCVLKHNDVSIACLTESWLNDSILTNVIDKFQVTYHTDVIGMMVGVVVVLCVM